ncbi:MAG TPA: RNA polymerase sigma-70 factor [Blastocatellia bacterium]|nr:RNA polymerase sigma-70 factor [Blastocatellia bacterium]
MTNDKKSEIGEAETTNDQSRLDVFNQHRGLLFSIAYRMLGTVADAEDMLQETFLRWQNASSNEINSPRAFLVTIISRLCINHLQSAKVKREEYFGQWLPEPLLTGPATDFSDSLQIDESLSMAFLVLLERLNPIERAVFLLREVFDYQYSEIAGVVGRNEADCRQILRRARQHVSQLRPRFDASPKQHEALLRQFREASANGDLEGLLAVLSKDVIIYTDGGGKAPALPRILYGREDVAESFLEAYKKRVPKDVVSQYVQVNGQPGIINYTNGQPRTVITFDILDDQIQNIYVVTNPEKLERLPRLA